MRLMQGDCLERMKEIKDGSVDMVLTLGAISSALRRTQSISRLQRKEYSALSATVVKHKNNPGNHEQEECKPDNIRMSRSNQSPST